jgi:hypothetical protein
MVKKSKLLRGAIVYAAVFFFFTNSTNVSAGLIIASGDATPAFYASDAGNDLFFKEIFGGGDNVVIDDPDNIWIGGNLNTYYNSLPGVTSTMYNNELVTDGLLSGVDLFVTSLVTDGLNSGELAALNTYISNGGSVMFMGDYTQTPDAINNALTGIGSNMRLYAPINDIGTQYATGSQIDATPLTVGITTFAYGATYGVSGGQSLFRDLSDRTFMAYEGSIQHNVPEPSSTMLLSVVGIFALVFCSCLVKTKKTA